jgi:hypothetical protein
VGWSVSDGVEGLFLWDGAAEAEARFLWVSRVGERKRGCECLANVENVYKRYKLKLRSTLTA